MSNLYSLRTPEIQSDTAQNEIEPKSSTLDRQIEQLLKTIGDPKIRDALDQMGWQSKPEMHERLRDELAAHAEELAAHATEPEPEPERHPELAENGVTNIRSELWNLDLPTTEKMLVFALIGHCGGKKNWCVVSKDRLVKDIGAKSIDTLERAIRRLKDRVHDDVPMLTVRPHRYNNFNEYVLPWHHAIDWKKSKKIWQAKRSS